jgi:hypothetical protein
MKKVAFLSLAVSASAFAIPQPYSIRVMELEALAKSKDVAKVIRQAKKEDEGTGFIDGIARKEPGFTKGGSYIITTGECTLGAEVSYEPLPPHKVGLGKMVIALDKELECP